MAITKFVRKTIARLTVVPLMAAMALARAEAKTGDPLDRSRLVPTFAETFDRPISLFNPATNPNGRWTTCYWFGSRPGRACPAPGSRTVSPEEPSIAVDPAYNGMNPFVQKPGSVALTILRASPDDPRTPGKHYGMGLLTTEDSFHQRYGYFEARISLPSVRGAWPAFWLLPANNRTPQEIDIMENMGVDPEHILCTAHWQDGSAAAGARVPTTRLDSPHLFGLLWTEQEIVWYVDDIEVFRTVNHDLHDAMYLILSMGVGGWRNSGNMPEDASHIVGAAMTVNFVRAYQFR